MEQEDTPQREEDIGPEVMGEEVKAAIRK